MKVDIFDVDKRYDVIYAVHQVIEEKVKRHSEKPHEARKRIVELLGDVKRIELFAREELKGWDCWGNEV